MAQDLAASCISARDQLQGNVDSGAFNDALCQSAASQSQPQLACWSTASCTIPTANIDAITSATTCAALINGYTAVCNDLAACTITMNEFCDVTVCGLQSEVDAGNLDSTACTSAATNFVPSSYSGYCLAPARTSAVQSATTCADYITAYSAACDDLTLCSPPAGPAGPPINPAPLLPPTPPRTPPRYPPIPPSSLTPNGLRYDEAPRGIHVRGTTGCPFPEDTEGDYLGKMMDACYNEFTLGGHGPCYGIWLDTPDCTSRDCCSGILELCQASDTNYPGLRTCSATELLSPQQRSFYVVSLPNPPRAPPPILPSPPTPWPLLPDPSSGGESGCGGGCIGGIIGGCFVPVLVCILWLSGAFAKFGCPSPFAKKTPKDAGVTMTNINDVNAAA